MEEAEVLYSLLYMLSYNLNGQGKYISLPEYDG